MSMNAPPQKKRKLNDDEYEPSENEEEVSEYEPSDGEQDEIDSFNDTDTDTHTNTNSNSNETEAKDQEMDTTNSNNESNDENDSNDDSEQSLSNEDKSAVRNMFKIVDSFTSPQLKSFLRNLKSLRSIDGESVFETIAMGGKKDELRKRVRQYIYMIYSGEVIVPNKMKWSWSKHKSYSETVDFDGWKSQIKQFLNLISSQSSKKKKSKNGSIFGGSLMSRLNACDKNQIIASLEILLKKQPNASELAKEFEELLPKPNLQSVFKRHTVLINAIGKARPYTRYGSSSDNYCFKRCRSAINTAKKAIINDGKNVMNSKEWDTCLEYLIVSQININNFPTWDEDKNNSAVRDLKKKLKVWYGKVTKGLGKNVNDIQKKRFQQLDDFFNEK